MMRTSLGQFARQHQVWSMDNFDDGYIDASGRFRVYLPSHPRASKTMGYVLRSIVAYEIYHNTVIPFSNNKFEIHHIDGDRLNDSKENLLYTSHGEHQKIHARQKGCYIEKICKNCHIPFEINRWRLKDPTRGQFCSQKCFHLKERAETHKANISKGEIRAWQRRKGDEK